MSSSLQATEQQLVGLCMLMTSGGGCLAQPNMAMGPPSEELVPWWYHTIPTSHRKSTHETVFHHVPSICLFMSCSLFLEHQPPNPRSGHLDPHGEDRPGIKAFRLQRQISCLTQGMPHVSWLWHATAGGWWMQLDMAVTW